ncbi:MAG: stage II sporulation protein M [Oscillospiraceae bacterium]|nr:stage II sporulation protein M [Oscillospiraceae bacterium]
MEHKTISAHSIALGVLALAFLAGIVTGCLFSVQGGDAADSAVKEYLTAFAGSAVDPPSVARVLADTVLYPVVCFILGFTIPGVLLIPLTVAFRGFLVAYTVASCVRVFGSLDGILFSLSLLGIPLFICLPCLFILGTSSLLTSHALFHAAIRRTKTTVISKRSFSRLAAALCVTAAAAASEWLLCPVLTRLVAGRL